MKILLLVPELFSNIGGIQVYNNYLVKALLELGYTLSVISINDTKKSDEINIRFTPAGEYKTLRKPAFILKVFQEVLSFRPHIIFCGHVNFAYFCMLVSTILKIPYYVFTYGIDVFNMGQLKCKGTMGAQKIVTISNFTKDILLKQINKNYKNNIFLLPPTFDHERFNLAPKPQYLMDRLGIKKNDKVLLTVTRISSSEKYKGYDKVLFALSQLLNFSTSQLPNFKYILVGSGDDLPRIKKIISKLNLKEHVSLPGYVSQKELIDYYNLCDVFVMPSKKEGFGIVFIEALACGKPVICGNKDGSRDAVIDGEIGILVDPDNMEEIKTAIIKSLKGEVDKRLLDGEYLRQRVIEAYGFDKFRERLREILNEKV